MNSCIRMLLLFFSNANVTPVPPTKHFIISETGQYLITETTDQKMITE